VYIARSESCAQAARLMRENHVGSLVVVAQAGTPVMPIGMITDRDLAVGVMALGLDADRTVVEAVMRPRIALVRDTDGLGRAVTLMRAEGVRRLPVVDADGNLVGILAADDLIELFADELAGLAAMIGKSARIERAERRAAP
jgi:signal-transduction protein with cAMP-binding, CBS, and nucleotidyltransferase domain